MILDPVLRLLGHVDEDDRTFRLDPAGAALLGWLPCPLVQIVFVLGRVHPASLGQLALVLAHEIGCAAAFAVASALVVGGWVAICRRFLRRIGPAATFALSFVLMLAIGFAVARYASPDVNAFAGRKARVVHIKVAQARAAALIVIAVGIAVALPAGRIFARRWLRWLPIAIAFAMMVADYKLLESDYWSAHFVLALASAVLAGAALSGAEVPRALRPAPRAIPALVAAIALLIVWGIGVPPSPGLAFRVLLTRATPFAMTLRRWGYNGPRGTPVIPPEQAEWFAPRRNLPPIPSTTPADEAAHAIVVMISVDCFRDDVFEDPKNRALFPELDKLRAESVYFSHAYGPGSQTVYTLSSWFSGKYFSQLFWSYGGTVQLWPANDPTKRFPRLLRDHGIDSTYVMAANWLGPTHKLANGFARYDNLRKRKPSRSYATADEAADHIILHLEEQTAPLFIYSHFMDAHPSYRGVPADLPEHDQYLAELHKVDTAIGRIRAKVHQLGYDDRTTIVISADHGETFGEHGKHHHGVSLFGELIHVPLIIRAPKYPPRTVDSPVATIDIGPTILDAFGVDTPSSMMGQSLVGVLRGGEPHFTRPIVSENRLEQAMIFPNGKKVIRDLHLGEGGAYDIDKDPLELDNRIDDPSFDVKNEFALLNEFFKNQSYKRKGYRVPFRR